MFLGIVTCMSFTATRDKPPAIGTYDGCNRYLPGNETALSRTFMEEEHVTQEFSQKSHSSVRFQYEIMKICAE